MKVLIVFSHPNSSSFNHAILDSISKGLNESKHDLRIKNLYEEGFDPVLSANDLKQLHEGETPSRIAKEQEQLLWADGLVFIYPLWWFDRPAILKGWFDVVFTNGVAFRYGQNGAEGLLKHKHAAVLITAGASQEFFDENEAAAHSHRSMTDGTLDFCGIQKITHRNYLDIINISDQARLDILNEVEAIGRDF